METFSSIISIIPEEDKVHKYEDGWLLLMHSDSYSVPYIEEQCSISPNVTQRQRGKSLTGTYSKNLNRCFKLLGRFFFNGRSCGETRITFICCLTKQSIYNRI